MTEPLSRRQLLRAAAAGVLALPLAARGGEAAPWLLSAYDSGRNQHRIGAAGHDAALSLPARGHHIELLPGRPGECLLFARRPGYYIARLDWHSGRQLAWYDYPADSRHGFGHGIVTQGRLITTDSDIASGDGLLTLRDPLTLAVQAELPSGGIGPHQLLAHGRGQLLVANGGILTLPESGRIKLNKGSMQPSLDLIDLAAGRSVARYTLADSRLSIRHLARIDASRCAVALQFEGDGAAPLAALWHAERGLSLLPLPTELAASAGGYAASIASNGRLVAATATRGDAVVLWDAAGDYLAAVPLPKPAGVAASADGRHFVASNELGDIVWIDTATLAIDPQRSRRYAVKWDNHLTLA